MTVNVLFAAKEERWPLYRDPLNAAIRAAGIDVNLATDIAPELVDYIVYAPNSDLKDFTPFTRAKAVLNLWAGVEGIVGNKTLNLPLTRMVDIGLTQGMVEWVCGHTLRHHLCMDKHIINPTNEWAPCPPPLAWDRSVVVFGMGELGSACATALAKFGFNVTGWSRSEKTIDRVTCLHGPDGLKLALAKAEIAILLLPDTPATNDTLNAETLALMPKGAVIINPGRGPLIDDDALLQSLDAGHIGRATLDTFRIEPLPENHPYWAHPKVTVTPHVAAETRAKYSSLTIAENIRRGQAGAPFLHLVDRSVGY
jgi:glyoxylate/hydroxypyruvate reductase A